MFLLWKKQTRYRCVDCWYFTHICDRCIEQAYDILEVESSELSGLDQSVRLLKPKKIKSYLDEFVIGQDQAKKGIVGSCI